MTRKNLKYAFAATFIFALCWFGAPFYVFVAEDNPEFVPFGWRAHPGDAPYTEILVAADFRDSSVRLRRLLSDHRQRLRAPALSVAIARDGGLIWAGSVGWADIDRRIPVTPDSMFRIGSTSKAVTGTVLARLVDRNTVALDAPIGSYLDDLPNEAWAPLTLRQLASHTAGIVGYAENSDLVGLYRAIWPRIDHADVREGLDYFDASALMFEPGTGFQYSSYDVVLESVVLQEAADLAFLSLLRREVTAPLDLGSPIADATHPDRTRFYMVDDDRYRETFRSNVSHRLAAGGLMARPRDMAILGAAWLDESFISRQTRDTFWTAQTLANGEVNEQHYAINWRVRDNFSGADQRFNANHGGVGKGSMSWLVVLPDEGITLSMMINTRIYPFSDWISIQDEILETVLSGPGPATARLRNFR